MKEALDIINNVIAQHGKVTDHLDLTGTKMNDINAIFSVQREAYKAVWSTSTVADMIKKRDELLTTIGVLEEGLMKHFAYEEKVLPLVLGELLMKDILDAHVAIRQEIVDAKANLKALEGDNNDELVAKRTIMVDTINGLSEHVINHAHAEEATLGLVKKIFEEKA